MLKPKVRNTETLCEIYSKLTNKDSSAMTWLCPGMDTEPSFLNS